DHKRFLMAISSGDIPRLDRLLSQALNDGAGITQILGRVELSLLGAYHARSFDEKDIDIAVLVYRLGGRSLLFALNKYIEIPSIRALQRAQAFTKIHPSFGAPQMEEVLFNIRQLISRRAASNVQESNKSPLLGLSLMMDEVNTEDAACYFPESDIIGGFCREHSHGINTKISNFDDAQALANALQDGSLHFGKETSVVAVASFGPALRGAFPLVVSPTCKQETPDETAHMLSTVLRIWRDEGAKHFGNIWSFASDGDAGRRAMVYALFFKYHLDSGHRLYKYLSRLPGLNLWVGEGDITADFDWKHLIKRIARLLRSQEGLVVGDTIVNRMNLKQHLCRVGDLSEFKIDNLLNPADAQDVPRAIDLINAVTSIGISSTSQCNPSEVQENLIFNAVGIMFSAFMNPFISPSWNLSQQVISLSKSAHMCCALFREYGTSFMPNQLYGDLQTAIKNIIFVIAKTQDLDGYQKVYIFQCGDDRLEILFGRLRMLGAHNANFTFKQILDRLSGALDIDEVFASHPDLDRGHRRLKCTRTEHADHLNPESWRGDARANSVNLETAWAQGRDMAVRELKALDLEIDFLSLFGTNRILDLLKPFGDGKYPGVSSGVDRSAETLETLDTMHVPETPDRAPSDPVPMFTSDVDERDQPDVEVGVDSPEHCAEVLEVDDAEVARFNVSPLSTGEAASLITNRCQTIEEELEVANHEFTAQVGESTA
ncbi:hypothetical protein SCHPADRAFT_826611, partial [Schizopora paradoxa]